MSAIAFTLFKTFFKTTKNDLELFSLATFLHDFEEEYSLAIFY